jgi:hypothetical protein
VRAQPPLPHRHQVGPEQLTVEGEFNRVHPRYKKSCVSQPCRRPTNPWERPRVRHGARGDWDFGGAVAVGVVGRWDEGGPVGARADRHAGYGSVVGARSAYGRVLARRSATFLNSGQKQNTEMTICVDQERSILFSKHEKGLGSNSSASRCLN